MDSYETITNIKKDDDEPAFRLCPTCPEHGPYKAPDPPTSQAFTYEPFGEVVLKDDVRSNGSWSEIRKRGSIVMTPYFHKRTTRRDHLVGVPDFDWFPFSTYYLGVGGVCRNKKDFRLMTTWTEQGDFPYWSKVRNVPIVPLGSSVDSKVRDAIHTSQSSAIAAFKSGFDLATEIAESREALSYFRGKTDAVRDAFKGLPPDTYAKDAYRRKLRPVDMLNASDVAMRALGKRWMEYRYAIMPLVYAYKDVYDLIENNGRLFQSFSSSEKLEFPQPTIPSGLPVRLIYQYSQGSVTVRSTVRAGYEASGLQSYVTSQVMTNLFATAWELVPLSFVIDWFVNIGDFIVSHTSMDLSIANAACTSVRTRLLAETLLSDETVTEKEYIPLPPSGNSCYPQGTKWTHKIERSVLSRLRTVEYDWYERTLFDSRDVRLALQNSPLEFWKRQADAAALSYLPLRKLLRRFQ